MDALTRERLGPEPTPTPAKRRRPRPTAPPRASVNRWGDTREDIAARQQALNRWWRDPREAR